MKYKKKPIIVEASQWWEHGDHPDVKKIPPPHLPQRRVCKHCNIDIEETHGNIETLEGVHIVCPGDWIITGIKGEKYPCKHDIFVMTYDPLDGQWRHTVHK